MQMQSAHNRENLIAQVKAEYARLADLESRDSFVSQVGEMPPEAYYEKLLDQVLFGIQAGRFDSFTSGREIVDAVAVDKSGYGIRM